MAYPAVIFEDKQVIAVRKPEGYLAQPDGSGRPDILSWSKAHIKQKWDKPGNVFLGLCHRLDFSAGGVMVLGKTSKAASRISAQFRERAVSKKYLALCGGEPGEAEGELMGSLFRKEGRTREAGPGEKGTEARLRFRVLGKRASLALLEVDLLTGFKHQIRAQLSQKGLPILGDCRYGGPPAPEGVLSIGLFAHRLSLAHPVSRETMVFEAEPDRGAWPWLLARGL